MRPLVLPLPGNEPLASRLALRLGVELAATASGMSALSPSHVNLRRSVVGRDLVLVASLTKLEEQLMPLLLLARQARGGGVASLLLVSPCLPAGDTEAGRGAIAVTLGARFDGVITVGGGSVSGRCGRVPWLSAAAWPTVAQALREVDRPWLVSASDGEPWMEDLAAALAAPLLGPATLEGALSGLRREELVRGRPVLLAERAGRGGAFLELSRRLEALGCEPPLAVAVHASDAWRNDVPRPQLWTTNTVVHSSNHIDVSESLAAAVQELWHLPTGRTADHCARRA